MSDFATPPGKDPSPAEAQGGHEPARPVISPPAGITDTSQSVRSPSSALSDVAAARRAAEALVQAEVRARMAAVHELDSLRGKLVYEATRRELLETQVSELQELLRSRDAERAESRSLRDQEAQHEIARLSADLNDAMRERADELRRRTAAESVVYDLQRRLADLTKELEAGRAGEQDAKAAAAKLQEAEGIREALAGQARAMDEREGRLRAAEGAANEERARLERRAAEVQAREEAHAQAEARALEREASLRAREVAVERREVEARQALAEAQLGGEASAERARAAEARLVEASAALARTRDDWEVRLRDAEAASALRMSRVEAELADAQGQLAQARTQLAQVREREAALEARLREVTSGQDALEARARSAEQGRSAGETAWAAERAELLERCARAEGQAREAQQAAAVTESQSAGLRAAKEIRDQELQVLRTRLAAAAGDRVGKEDAEQRCVALAARLAEQQARADRAERAVAEAATAVEAERRRSAKADTACAQAHDASGALRAELSAVQAALDRARESVADQEAANLALRARVQTLSEELQARGSPRPEGRQEGRAPPRNEVPATQRDDAAELSPSVAGSAAPAASPRAGKRAVTERASTTGSRSPWPRDGAGTPPSASKGPGEEVPALPSASPTSRTPTRRLTGSGTARRAPLHANGQPDTGAALLDAERRAREAAESQAREVARMHEAALAEAEGLREEVARLRQAEQGLRAAQLEAEAAGVEARRERRAAVEWQRRCAAAEERTEAMREALADVEVKLQAVQGEVRSTEARMRAAQSAYRAAHAAHHQTKEQLALVAQLQAEQQGHLRLLAERGSPLAASAPPAVANGTGSQAPASSHGPPRVSPASRGRASADGPPSRSPRAANAVDRAALSDPRGPVRTLFSSLPKGIGASGSPGVSRAAPESATPNGAGPDGDRDERRAGGGAAAGAQEPASARDVTSGTVKSSEGSEGSVPYRPLEHGGVLERLGSQAGGLTLEQLAEIGEDQLDHLAGALAGSVSLGRSGEAEGAAADSPSTSTFTLRDSMGRSAPSTGAASLQARTLASASKGGGSSRARSAKQVQSAGKAAATTKRGCAARQ